MLSVDNLRIDNLSFIFTSDSILSTRQTIIKITKTILYKYHKAMTAYQIRNLIMTEYAIEFTAEEIIESCQSNNTDLILRIDALDIACSEIELRHTEYFNYESYEPRNILEDSIKRFFANNPEYKDLVAIFDDRVSKFIYLTFQTSLRSIAKLLDVNGVDVDEINAVFPDDSFSLREKQGINAFLNWPDKLKNKAIVDIMSVCLNYLLVATRAKKDELIQISKSIFFLDANVLLRQIGLNGSARKEVIDSFINKCKDLGINLRVTNFTSDEIEISITSNTRKISFLNQDMPPVSVETMRKTSTDWHQDYYITYIEWLKETGKPFTAYRDFEQHLNSLVAKLIDNYNFDSRASFAITHKSQYNQLVNSLYEYKLASKYSNNEHKDSARIDINNVLTVFYDRKEQGISRPDICMISTDKKLIEWTRKNFPGEKTLVELPSVWLSILLQISGRATENDYQTFCKLITLRYTEEDLILRDGPAILNTIRSMQTSVDFQDQVVFQLTHYSSRYDYITDIKERVATAIDDIFKSKVEDEKQKIEKEKLVEIEQIREDYQSKFKDAAEKHKDALDQETKVAQERGKEQSLKAGCMLYVEDTKHKNKKILTGAVIVFVVSCVALIVTILSVIFFTYVDQKQSSFLPIMKFIKDNSVVLFWLFGLISSIFVVAKLALKFLHKMYPWFLSTNEEILEQQYIKRVSKLLALDEMEKNVEDSIKTSGK